MKRASLLILLIPAAIAFAQIPPAHQWLHKLSDELCAEGAALLNAHTDADGSRRYYAASAERLARSPEWDGNGNPPLILGAATELARTYLAKRHPEHRQFPLSSAGLFSTGTQTFTNRWYYRLEFRIPVLTTSEVSPTKLGIAVTGDWEMPEKVTVESKRMESFEVYMMLDGSIIDPTPIDKESANQPSEGTR